MGPPVVTRRWDAAAVKAGVADESVRRLGDVPPSERSQAGARVVSQLHELGWRPQQVEGGFAAGQPQYNFQIPLCDSSGAPRTEEDVLAGMNQQWRRNIKKAAKAGVEVVHGTPADLPAFHELYAHTAERDHFTPRPLSYFQTMFTALLAEEPDRIRLYLARHEGELVAATVWVRVGGHTWYSYGASSTEKRDVRGSNAVQWAMIRDALAAGAGVYDLRGITDTLDPDDSHVGLIQFKVGTGGEAVEYAGEWDLPLNPVVYKAFSLYMSRR
jgi:vancomycin resistance protein VanK